MGVIVCRVLVLTKEEIQASELFSMTLQRQKFKEGE